MGTKLETVDTDKGDSALLPRQHSTLPEEDDDGVVVDDDVEPFEHEIKNRPIMQIEKLSMSLIFGFISKTESYCGYYFMRRNSISTVFQ
jgi:hypothetical protein